MSRHRARKRFGQHFLKDPGVIHAIVEAVRPGKDETIAEIGPGTGAITTPIARRAAHLHLIELDRDLAASLRQRFAADSSVSIHEADALRFDFGSLGPSLRVVGNLPYNISTPLLFHLLDYRHSITDMHFMLQKEVVDRISAGPGSKTYGRLSVMLACYLYAERLFDVPPGAFDPPPAVTSAVLRLVPRQAGDIDIADEAHLARLVAAAFGQRRKTLRNALSDLASAAEIEAAGIDPAQRAEQLGAPAFVSLSNSLCRRQS